MDYATPEMRALFAPEAHVRQLLAFEAALARAEARAGLLAPEAALAIEAACRDGQFDATALYEEAALSGTPVVPLLRALNAQLPEAARGFAHWGATSQDAIDTALGLQMRAGLDLLVSDLGAVCDSCAALAERHRRTLMAGRTLLQQALPISFGLKAARWLALAARQAQALTEARAALALQFGGAVGTLAALGGDGLRVAVLLADELGLMLPELPWHAERDRIATVAAALGVAAGAMGKIAGDIVLLAQTEVGEASEAAAPGKGGSSAMPQKRNPVDAVGALAAARLALGVVPVVMMAVPHEHERAAGAWQAEWSAIPALFCHTAGAVARVRDAVNGLEIDAARMRANLDSSGMVMAESLTMALAPQLGRVEAQRLVQALCARALAERLTLAEVAVGDATVGAALAPEAVARALDPAGYLGSADALIDRALGAYRELRDS